MADYHNANEFRLSSSAFAWGDLVFTDYKTGCYRKILLQSQTHQSAIDPKYAEIGKLNEDRHEARLIQANVKYLREVTFTDTIPQVPGVTLSGHADFVHTDGLNPTMVDELKSVSSKNVRRNVIKNGEFGTENLAQLVSYMGQAKVQMGRLIYTYYEQDTKTLKYEAIDERIFLVTIDDFGKIAVDSKPTQYSYNDVIAHRVKAALVIQSGAVVQRPYRWDLDWVSPCKFCAFKVACDKFDADEIESDGAFVEYVKTSVEGVKP